MWRQKNLHSISSLAPSAGYIAFLKCSDPTAAEEAVGNKLDITTGNDRHGSDPAFLEQFSAAPLLLLEEHQTGRWGMTTTKHADGVDHHRAVWWEWEAANDKRRSDGKSSLTYTPPASSARRSSLKKNTTHICCHLSTRVRVYGRFFF